MKGVSRAHNSHVKRFCLEGRVELCNNNCSQSRAYLMCVFNKVLLGPWMT